MCEVDQKKFAPPRFVTIRDRRRVDLRVRDRQMAVGVPERSRSSVLMQLTKRFDSNLTGERAVETISGEEALLTCLLQSLPLQAVRSEVG